MLKLYSMNIILYIFLIQFVVNKERFFFRKKGVEKKLEFTLDLNTLGGMNFYKYLNETKIREVKMTFDLYFINGIILFGEVGVKQTDNYQKGDLIATNNWLYIQIKAKFDDAYEKIGAFTKPEELDSYFDYSTPGNYVYDFEFLLVEESNKIPEKRKESGGWKTAKMLKKVKALKRYRIVKRLDKLKLLKN